MASRSGSPALQTTRKQQPGAPKPFDAPSSRPASSASTPKPPPSSAGPAAPAKVPDLEQLLNLPIRVKVAAAGPDVPEREVEGSLFAVDASFVVLSSAASPPPQGDSTGATTSAAGEAAASGAPQRTYHLLKTSTLLSVSVLSPHPDPSLPPSSTPLPFSHLPRTPSDLSHAVGRALAAQARVGQGVSPDAQRLFDALARTLPVRWAGESIVVLDEVVVEKPYGVGNVRGAKGSGERVERVRKMVRVQCFSVPCPSGLVSQRRSLWGATLGHAGRPPLTLSPLL